jgi:NDP-sugar pyrophosphorylase family protein
MINIITLAGEGSRFKKTGVDTPKPLIKVDDIPMIIRSVNCLPIPDKYVFVCRKEHIEKYNIDKLLKSEYSNCEFVVIDRLTEGQACSVEIGIKESSIKDDDAILISCCDYGIEWNVEKYELIKNKSDVVVWSTIRNKAFSRNPSSYSWLEVDGSKLVKTHVKQDFFDDSYNNHAIIGTFFFNKASDFILSLQKIYDLNIRSNGEYYIDNMFNTMTNLNINIFDVEKYHCWGTPEDLKNYENQILG